MFIAGESVVAADRRLKGKFKSRGERRRLRAEPRQCGCVAVGAAARPCADAPTRTSLSAAATHPHCHVFGQAEAVAPFLRA